jgi:hypothetical protein
LEHLVSNDIQVQVTKVDKNLSKKMAVISNQIQILTAKVLTPFSDHNINMEIFFEVVAEKVKPIIKEIEEKRAEEER